MIKIEKVSVMNIENAIRGARNPMNSWGKSDSDYEYECGECEGCPYDANEKECLSSYQRGAYLLGEDDLTLLTKLCKAGSDHRKFMRQIFVSVDITAPLYWWKEYDTYKVGTTANSCSTMHKIHAKEFTLEDFSADHLEELGINVMVDDILPALEDLRQSYIESKDKKYWYSLIQLLPSSYNQLRTCTMTYENLLNMYHARKNHKLDEWREFCSWIETLPYAKELIIGE